MVALLLLLQDADVRYRWEWGRHETSRDASARVEMAGDGAVHLIYDSSSGIGDPVHRDEEFRLTPEALEQVRAAFDGFLDYEYEQPRLMRVAAHATWTIAYDDGNGGANEVSIMVRDDRPPPEEVAAIDAFFQELVADTGRFRADP